jgi:hypothetical protein
LTTLLLLLLMEIPVRARPVHNSKRSATQSVTEALTFNTTKPQQPQQQR